MRNFQVRRRQLMAIFLLAFVGLLSINQTALADNVYLQGDTIDSGETVENDVFLNGTDIALNGTVAGDVFAVGRSVVINGEVQGSMVILAENIIINGDIQNSVYAASVSLNTLSGSTIGRNLYFLGISLGTERDSQIGRDLNAITLGAQQSGSVGRNTTVISGFTEIARLILDRINNVTTGKPIARLVPATEGITLADQAANPRIFAAALGPVNGASTLKSPAQIQEEPVENAAVDWIVEFLRHLISLLLIGGLAIWLIPTRVNDWANQVRQRPIASAGWGLVAYFIGFLGAGTMFLLILVIGISFAVITLWGLAWTWWAVGFSALALAFSLFILAVAYGSKVIVAYMVGRLILERFGVRPDMRKPWPLLLGLIIFVLLCNIPYLGWVISVIVTFLGLGAIWLTFMDRKNQANELDEPAVD